MAREIKPQIVTNNNSEYRFVLEPYTSASSRGICPNCNSKHSYAMYIDKTTGERLPEEFGRCEKVDKCGYFNSPYGKDLGNKSLFVTSNEILDKFKDLTSGITNVLDPKLVADSITFEDEFSKFVIRSFPDKKDSVYASLNKYKVGESDKWKGATTFWQIDKELNVRTGKIILYTSDGKRRKEPYPFMSWEHVPYKRNKVQYNTDFNLKQCLYGEHLLRKDDTDIVHVVESEKTAVICSIFNDKAVWLATGGIELINYDKLLPLKDKKVVFFPDKGKLAFDKWTEKINSFKNDGFDFSINNSINKMDLQDGEDMADYLINKFSKI